MRLSKRQLIAPAICFVLALAGGIFAGRLVKKMAPPTGREVRAAIARLPRSAPARLATATVGDLAALAETRSAAALAAHLRAAGRWPEPLRAAAAELAAARLVDLDPDAALELAIELEPDSAGANALADSLAKAWVEAGESPDQIAGRLRACPEWLLPGLSAGLAAHRTPDEALAIAKQLPPYSYRCCLESISLAFTRSDPARAVRLAEEIGIGNSRAQNPIVPQVYARWAMQDPAAAAADLAHVQSSRLRLVSAPKIATEWAKQDYPAAKTWVEADLKGAAQYNASLEIRGFAPPPR